MKGLETLRLVTLILLLFVLGYGKTIGQEHDTEKEEEVE